MRLTSAQLIVDYLVHEKVPYALGIFGHGNVALAEALKEREKDIEFILVKNEQNAAHIASAYAWMTGRPLAVTTSIGPGATNLCTGAFAAFLNRLPVLLLPGDAFADNIGPVLQEPDRKNLAGFNAILDPIVNRAFRITRPEQLARVLPKAFEAMLKPGNEGPVLISLPMDAQAFSCDYDLKTILKPRDVHPQRTIPDAEQTARAANAILKAKRPLIVAGGGAMRNEGWRELQKFAELTGIPVVQTQTAKGALLWDHPLNCFHAGAKATLCGNRASWAADLVIGVGVRWTDMTTASETLYKNNPEFININLDPEDAGKQRALKLLGDAGAGLAAMGRALKRNPKFKALGKGTGADYRHPGPHFKEVQKWRREWLTETDRLRAQNTRPMNQAAVIGMVNDFCVPNSTVVTAAGSLPAEAFQLWRDKDPKRKGYHCESGASVMGYEIAGGLGVKLADPSRETVVLVGDFSFLMASQEIVTAVQLGVAYTIVVFDNNGGQSIRHLQMGSGFREYGMEFNRKGKTRDYVPVDYAKIAEGMGALAIQADDPETFQAALQKGRETKGRPTAIVCKVDKENLMGTYGGWWDVPRPEASKNRALGKHLEDYRKNKKKQKVR